MWTAAGNEHPYQLMMSSTHSLGGRPIAVSVHHVQQHRLYQSVIVYSTNVSKQVTGHNPLPPDITLPAQ